MIEEVDFSFLDFDNIASMTLYPNGDFNIVTPEGHEGFYKYSVDDYSEESDDYSDDPTEPVYD